MTGVRLHENMPTGLVRDVFQQRPERLAMNVGTDLVLIGLPYQGMSPRARGYMRIKCKHHQQEDFGTVHIHLVV